MDRWSKLIIIIVVIIAIFLIIWLKYGGKTEKFEGLDFLQLYGPTPASEQPPTIESPPPPPPVEAPPVLPPAPAPVQKFYFDVPVDQTIEVTSVPVARRTTRQPSRGERTCCEVMERIYGKPFSSHWGGFLVNPETQAEMELDCYNDELRLAVEYNGTQHYQWPNFTGQSEEDWIKQLRRDKLKRELCDLNGVYLITVPEPTVKIDQIESFIRSKLPEVVSKSAVIPSRLAALPPLR
jgi:hypothetical protein